MGVWIEITWYGKSTALTVVTPCVGVWIEIDALNNYTFDTSVTPCVGVWIEILMGCGST